MCVSSILYKPLSVAAVIGVILVNALDSVERMCALNQHLNQKPVYIITLFLLTK